LPLPNISEAQPFYRAALHRFEDAEFLLQGKPTTGAVYLAGYSVECMLKAMAVASTPRNQRRRLWKEFRGAKAHDFEWLKRQCSIYWKGGLPGSLARHFSRVNTWSTALRYDSTATKEAGARGFLTSAAEIMNWIDQRL
jgi:hypothetical protein